MLRMHVAPRGLAVLLSLVQLVSTVSLFATPLPDGIYAAFETSLGNFTVRLDHTNAPKTVANFIGLAEGTRAWIDPLSGTVQKKPFYNGLTFHRVINGFIIQSGSRTGDGTDGPGYVFEDELSQSHDAAGVLSMANSGPRSNGAQFFFTLAPTPSLDGKHSVFGRVVEGLQVIMSIGAVETDCTKAGGGVCTNNGAFANKPTTDVIINKVTIQRIGAAANAFDIHVQGLPTVSSPSLQLERTGSGKTLNLTRKRNSEYTLLESQDLLSWQRNRLGIYSDVPPTNGINLAQFETGAETKNFFSVTEVSYPTNIFTPRIVAGGRFVSRDRFLDITLGTEPNTGNVRINAGQVTGAVFAWSWGQEPYRARLQVAAEIEPPLLDLTLTFTNYTAGTFTGFARTLPDFTAVGQFSGSFDFIAPPNP